MAKYAFIEDNIIKEIHYSLPINWRNISGFGYLEGDDEKLKELGWYKIIENTIDYDKDKYTCEISYVFQDDRVIESYQLNEITGESAKELQRRFFILIRDTRNEKLAASDWTMMTDIIRTKDASWVTAWETYRQSLRDFPSQFNFLEDEIPVSFDTISWPERPVI